MVDRDLPLHAGTAKLSLDRCRLAVERAPQDRAGLFHRFEGQPAVQHANLEATRQEPTLRPAPIDAERLGFGVAFEWRELIATVVVDDEQPASGSEDPLGVVRLCLGCPAVGS